MLGNFVVDGPAEPLPAAVEVAAYRIAMEAMTNVDPPRAGRVGDRADHRRCHDDGACA